MTLDEFNAIDAADAATLLQSCCGSREWVTRMNALRPFANLEALLSAADSEWLRLGQVDWMEAFHAHPRIGERTESPISLREQSQIYSADEKIARAIVTANADYERRFGFIFLVFATGKTPEQILKQMKDRLQNPREVEIRIAVGEQMKITRLRLRNLIEE
jgi:OHCU decarboxylase